MIGAVLTPLTALLSFLVTPIALAVLALFLAAVYCFLTRNYDYWSLRGVPGPRAKFPWGNEFGLPFVSSIAGFEDWIYHRQGGKQYCGYIELDHPVLYVGDLDLIRAITIKDFEHFTDRPSLILTKEFKLMLQMLTGKEWKDVRSVISPTFSGSKLRHMHQMCIENAQHLNKYLQDEMSKNDEINIKDAFGKFTMDNIAMCAFGVNCNSFNDSNSKFTKMGSQLLKPPSAFFAFHIVAGLVLGKRVMSLLPNPFAKVTAFFKRCITETIAHREKHGFSRNDLLQLLMDTKDKDGNRILSIDSIFAQSILFFFAGYDTTASLLTFVAFCLATSPNWQRKVHEEIDQVLAEHGGQLTYDAVQKTPLLDRVISETLRLYPPAARLDRVCTKEYTLPGTDVTIPVGMLVAMPVMALHRDPDIYPNPMKFDPDRFLPEQKNARHPCANMPFGTGPRSCVAQRFALFEAKVALLVVLQYHRLEPGPRTPPPPCPVRKVSLILSPDGGTAYMRAVLR